jgi:integrase
MGKRLPDCDSLFHVNGKPVGSMLSELRRTCEALGIPFGRGKGIVFHDTRHSAVTNLVGAGVSEVVAMTVTGHADSAVFQRYNVRCDDVQADALDGRRRPHAAAGHDANPSGASPAPEPEIRGTT